MHFLWQKIFLQLVLWYLSLWSLPSLKMAIMGALYLWNTYILFQIQSREVIYTCTCNYICRILFFQKYDGKTDSSVIWKLEQADSLQVSDQKAVGLLLRSPFPRVMNFPLSCLLLHTGVTYEIWYLRTFPFPKVISLCWVKWGSISITYCLYIIIMTLLSSWGRAKLDLGPAHRVRAPIWINLGLFL